MTLWNILTPKELTLLCYAARACRNLLPASMGQSMDAFSTALRCLQLHCAHGTCSVSMPGAIWQAPLPCGVKARNINFSDAKPGDWDVLLSCSVCFISLDIVPV